MAPSPEVSVIIPAYNVRDCIEKSIDSALAQCNVDIEVIVIDDASTDDTAARVSERYRDDARVKLIRQYTNRGPGVARNQGFKSARGNWVALLDADDWWKPQRLEIMLARAADYDFIADNIMGYDVGHQTETWPIYPHENNCEIGLIDFVLPASEKKHDFGYLQPMMRRQFLTDHQLGYQENIRVGEDLLFNMEFMVKGGRGLFINEANYVYALPVGPISGLASPFSKTRGDADTLVEAISKFRKTYAELLDDDVDTAITLRLSALKQRAPVASFHMARANSNYGRMILLATTNLHIQRMIFRRLLQRSQKFLERS